MVDGPIPSVAENTRGGGKRTMFHLSDSLVIGSSLFSLMPDERCVDR